MRLFFSGLITLNCCLGCSFFDWSSESLVVQREVEETVILDCEAGREFITSYQFLVLTEPFKVPEPRARELALKVSEGCTGAAGRFIEIAELLSRSGLSGNDAVVRSLEFARATDGEVDTFSQVFRRAYSRDQLDLDLPSSIAMARSLSVDFKGDAEMAGEDFLAVLDFCIEEEGLELSRSICADLASRVARSGENYNGSAAEAFFLAFRFLKSKDGPGLPTGDALRLVENLLDVSPAAVKSFQSAYEFAFADSGLGMTRQKAISLAMKVASNTAFTRKERRLSEVVTE